MPHSRDVVLMRQLNVFRCDVYHAPFLFENNLQDHVIAAHAPKVDPAPTDSAKKRKGRRKKTQRFLNEL